MCDAFKMSSLLQPWLTITISYVMGGCEIKNKLIKKWLPRKSFIARDMLQEILECVKTVTYIGYDEELVTSLSMSV